MSQVPPGDFPEPPSSDQPQPQFSHYRRPGEFVMYGDPDRLQALADGYFGLNKRFLIYLLIFLPLYGVWLGISKTDPGLALLVLFAWLGISFASSFLLSLSPNRKIAYGKAVPESNAYLYSLLTATFFWLCCGAIGFAIPQNIAAAEIKKYGLKVGAFTGLKKKDVQAKIDEMRMATVQSPLTQPSPPDFQS